ncbi:MAG: Hok/Gef family protein [Enterobacteriaceae bacterium]|jgi:protein HokA|nr:Hok/Gef family protein [Enterobacteriaceae bacterium]
MPRKSGSQKPSSQELRLYALIVICFTILLFTWLMRDSLCELHIKQRNVEIAAFLNYEVKS